MDVLSLSWWEYFLIGLLVGLVFVLVIWIVMGVKLHKAKKRERRETERYKAMLSQRMELESEGLGKLKSENEDLKRQNQTLSVSLQTMSQKPGRKELVRLQVYQRAIERLMINSPGFGPAWQAALMESEEEFSKTFTGTIPFLRKFIPSKSDASLIEDDK